MLRRKMSFNEDLIVGQMCIVTIAVDLHLAEWEQQILADQVICVNFQSLEWQILGVEISLP